MCPHIFSEEGYPYGRTPDLGLIEALATRISAGDLSAFDRDNVVGEMAVQAAMLHQDRCTKVWRIRLTTFEAGAAPPSACLPIPRTPAHHPSTCSEPYLLRIQWQMAGPAVRHEGAFSRVVWLCLLTPPSSRSAPARMRLRLTIGETGGTAARRETPAPTPPPTASSPALHSTARSSATATILRTRSRTPTGAPRGTIWWMRCCRTPSGAPPISSASTR
jgi:hypothetical protein